MAYDIQSCSCENEYFDRIHGAWMRLHTVTNQNNPNKRQARCVICGKVKDLSRNVSLRDLRNKTKGKTK